MTKAVRTVRPVNQRTLDDEAKASKLRKKKEKPKPPPLDPRTDDIDPRPATARTEDFELTGEPEDGETEEPPEQTLIQDGMVLMRFVKVVPQRDKRTQKRALHLHLSCGLNDQAVEHFGQAIADYYAMLRDDAGIGDLHIANGSLYTMDLKETAEAPNAKEGLHKQVVAQKISLTAVQQKGEGEARTVIRLSFVAPIEQSDTLSAWACNTHGELVWVSMRESQGRLLK
jgi:hypothetical protein